MSARDDEKGSRQGKCEKPPDPAASLHKPSCSTFQLVGNLLDMTRLEGGALQVRREPCDIQDVIGAALEKLNPRLAGRAVDVDLPADLPTLTADSVLIGRVLVNVIDRGEGFPPGDLNRVFDKFYRVRRPQDASGTGLGLAICKGIVEAHGGFVSAENRTGGGTVITIGLPMEGGR